MSSIFKGITSIFKAPKVPDYTPPPAPVVQPVAPQVAAPTADNSAAEIQKAQDEEKERRTTQRGRAATLLTRGQGVMGDDAGIASKKLLGK